jgi:hypothetical protein
MTYSRHENQVAVPPTKLLMEALVAVVLCGTLVFSAQAQNPQQTSSGESWTTTTESSVANTNPSRMTQSHTKSGNRTVDTQRVEMLGVDGRYQPFSETETETVQADATTTRTVVRTYRWDGDGRRTLAQVTEEEARSTASGEGHAVRTTSNSDVNGKLQVVKREVTDTRETSPDARETKTKVYLADGNGGFAMALQTQELQKHGADDTVEVKKTTLVPDGNGDWKVAEQKDKTVTAKGRNQTTEERVSRPDLEGRLSEFSRTVGQETESPVGEKKATVDTYFRDVPGSTDGGSMHRTQRLTTIQKRTSSGEITEQQVEQPNPGNPSDGPKVTSKTTYTVRYAASGVSQQTKTVQVPDGNGNFYVLSFDTRKSEPVSPSQKPKASAD